MSFINSVYDSPVNIIHQVHDQMETTIKDGVLQVATKFMVDIDEQKLYEALTHDRKRYSEAYKAGYRQGYADALESVKTAT